MSHLAFNTSCWCSRPSQGAPLAPGAKLPLAGTESIMSPKAHGTTAKPVQVSTEQRALPLGSPQEQAPNMHDVCGVGQPEVVMRAKDR